MPTKSSLKLFLTDLKVQASIGILAHELVNPQTISIDIELNLKSPLSSSSDCIDSVLDYRKVREIAIAECTKNHINLLENLAEKLSRRLLTLPNVIEARIRITKLEAFNDCKVAIEQQVAQ